VTDQGFDIAGLCAHPDDAELIMGGTVAREAAAGRRVALVDLTRGECGSRGTKETLTLKHIS
jgi:LmbE family N-acetylglucosaminyl deacetylase